jgi:membrane-associated phospholipid phosphatase
MLEIILNLIGEFGPIILFLCSIYLLWKKRNLLFYYIIGVFANSILNIILKGIIQQPRPSEDEKLFNLALSNSAKNVFKNGLPFDTFGMPSGHAQSVFFSTCFIYLALKNRNILLFYLLFSFLTMFQRVYNNYHTIFQIIVGSLLGTLFAWFVFHLAQQKLKGRIREKFDDFGPI